MAGPLGAVPAAFSVDLTVLAGPDVGRSFELKTGALLGRSPDCDLRLRDRSVSRRHARVEHEGGRWFLVDLGSRNGLRVEGRRVERCELSDFCEVVLGELPLRFRADPEPATPPPAAPAKRARSGRGQGQRHCQGPGRRADDFKHSGHLHPEQCG